MKHVWQNPYKKTRTRINSKLGRGKVDLNKYANSIIKSVEAKEERALERNKYG